VQWVVEAVEVHRRRVLDGVSFGAPARAVTAVVGGDAHQRTLLFRMAAGLAQLDRGAMLVLGEDMSRARRRARARIQRRLGVIFGGPDQALFADGTAWENVALAVRAAGRTGRAGADAAVESALDAVGLGHVGGELPGSLTIAQRRRLALARAIALNAPLLLGDALDEDGDPAEAVRLGGLVRDACRRRGGAAVLFLGDPAVAECVADVVVDLAECGAGPAPDQLPTALMRR
jgi:ABC-type transporter Mla maintaining outer membrane lipid asymmetry ATPase subunit MlaF